MIDHKYFESQQPDETVILLTRRHILALFPAIIIAIMIYVVGFAAIIAFPLLMPTIVSGYGYNIFVLLLSLLFLFNTVFLFSAWVLHYLHVALLTTEHFVEISQNSLFSRKISELSLDKIQDVSSAQNGIINTMFDLGTVTVETAGEAPNFILQYLPNPSKISQLIMETEEDYCKRHGIRGDGTSGNANLVNSNVTNNSCAVEPEPVTQPQSKTETQLADTESKPGPIEYIPPVEGSQAEPGPQNQGDENDQNEVQ